MAVYVGKELAHGDVHCAVAGSSAALGFAKKLEVLAVSDQVLGPEALQKEVIICFVEADNA